MGKTFDEILAKAQEIYDLNDDPDNFKSKMIEEIINNYSSLCEEEKDLFVNSIYSQIKTNFVGIDMIELAKTNLQ
jgi:hypothetical protein